MQTFFYQSWSSFLTHVYLHLCLSLINLFFCTFFCFSSSFIHIFVILLLSLLLFSSLSSLNHSLFSLLINFSNTSPYYNHIRYRQMKLMYQKAQDDLLGQTSKCVICHPTTMYTGINISCSSMSHDAIRHVIP